MARVYQRDEVDGVPVFWTEAPADLPFTAALVFRVGFADETLPTNGVSHLVEHLALPAERLAGVELNGSVDDLFTLFYYFAHDEPAAALAQLQRMAAALGELPLDRLPRERGILETEASNRGPALVPHRRSLRYGPRGHGLRFYEEFGLQSLSPDDVSAWAASRFTRGNVAVYLTAPPPDDFRLELPPGTRVPAPTPRPIEYLEFPCGFAGGVPNLAAVSLIVPRRFEATVGLGVLEHRLRERLRYRHGVTYEIGWEYEPLTLDEAHAVVWADCLDANVELARNELLAALDDLATIGPTTEELQQDEAAFDASLDSSLGIPGALYVRATRELLGGDQESDDDLRADRAAVTPDGVADMFEGALRTALVSVPADASLPGGRFGRYPVQPPRRASGRVYKRSGLLARRRSGVERQLIVGDDGVTLIADGFTSTVLFADCVACIRYDGDRRALWSGDGFYVLVEPEIWRHGARAVAEIDGRVPADAVFDVLTEPRFDDPDLTGGAAALDDRRYPEAIAALEAATGRLPDDPAAWTLLAAAYYGERRFRDMLRAADRAVALDPTLDAAHRYRAYALWFTGRAMAAADAAADALAQHPTDVEVLSDCAWLLTETGRLAEGRRAADRAVELYPESGAAWFAVGINAISLGDFDAAERALRRAVELEDGEAIWWSNLGWAYLASDRPREALDCFQKAVDRDPDNFLAAGNLVLALRFLGRVGRADELARRYWEEAVERHDAALERDPADVDALIARASSLLHLGRPDEALSSARAAAAIAADRPDVLFEAAALESDLGDGAEGRRRMTEAVAQAPDAVQAMFYRAYYGAVDGDPAAAEAAAERFAELHGSHPLAAETAGYAAVARDDLADARAHFQRAVTRDPLRCCANAWLGITLATADPVAAGERLERAAKVCVRAGRCQGLRTLRSALDGVGPPEAS
jgi:tetratricopeptide (TPR) repeat protein